MSEKHTPTPWKARPHELPQWKICGPDGDLHIIATTSQGNDEANARFIDLAANAHERLVDMGAGLLRLLANRMAPEEFCDIAVIDQALRLLAEIKKEMQA